jgi:hypothetical protein
MPFHLQDFGDEGGSLFVIFDNHNLCHAVFRFAAVFASMK